MTYISFILYYIIILFVGDGKTRGETQEEERESDDENVLGVPEEVRSLAQSLNEDHNGNENENQDEDQIEENEIEIEAAIREDDKSPHEAESTYENQESLSDDEEERQEGMEAFLPNWNSCTHPEQTMQFGAQNTVLENKMYERGNCSNPPVSSNDFHCFPPTLSFLPNDVTLNDVLISL